MSMLVNFSDAEAVGKLRLTSSDLSEVHLESFVASQPSRTRPVVAAVRHASQQPHVTSTIARPFVLTPFCKVSS
jgi:hypothetical protein